MPTLKDFNIERQLHMIDADGWLTTSQEFPTFERFQYELLVQIRRVP